MKKILILLCFLTFLPLFGCEWYVDPYEPAVYVYVPDPIYDPYDYECYIETWCYEYGGFWLSCQTWDIDCYAEKVEHDYVFCEGFDKYGDWVEITGYCW